MNTMQYRCSLARSAAIHDYRQIRVKLIDISKPFAGNQFVAVIRVTRLANEIYGFPILLPYSVRINCTSLFLIKRYQTFS